MPSIRSAAILLGLAAVLAGATTLSAAKKKPAGDAREPVKDSLEKDYSSELPRIAPLDAAEAQRAIEVLPGFRVEQVAAEPLVTDPTALAFDEHGRLFVNEMRGYSEEREQNLGLVRLLEDTDQDGRFDKSTVFLDGLAWPTAVTCYDGGVFVAVPPDIFYCKDTDGDGRADTKEVVFTGFGLGNVQGLLNTFTWGLDNRIHGATSSSGGTIRSMAHPDAEPLGLRGRDFAIEPRTRTIAPTSGGAQHGLSFDRWGDRFVCSNSDHIQLVLFEDRYVARNPYLAAPGPRESIAADGPQADVFRISPVEPWRVVRTRLRATGVVQGIVEGGGRPAGYFTGATGVTIYRGDAWPADYHGNAFTGDVGSNLVHRKRLEPKGVSQIARRADQGREFIASRDIWFRPVQMANAPDGTLYIADMAREVIEHPHSIPPMIKKHLDLTSGRDRGRIYRVVPDGFQQPRRALPGKASTPELVAMLAHANGWHRAAASRLLYERQDPAAAAFVEKLARESKLPEGRMHALYALDGLGALRDDVILERLDDEQPRVRQHAVRLAERLAAGSPAVRRKLYAMTDDDDVRVRYQLAFTLGELEGRERNAALARLARRDAADSWVALAIMSSLNEGSGEVLADLAADAKFRNSKPGRRMLEDLARQIGAQNRQHDLAAVIHVLGTLSDEDRELLELVVRGVIRGAGARGKSLQDQLAAATGGRADKLLDDMVRAARDTALDEKQPADQRAEALRTLALDSFDQARPVLGRMIDHRQPLEVQRAALATLGEFDDAAVTEILIDAFAGLSPQLRSEALETVFSRPAWLAALLVAIEQSRFNSADIDAPRVQLLLAHRDHKLRDRAKKVLGQLKPSPRVDVVQTYRDVLEMEGDAERGRLAFRKICAACHRVEGQGHEIGPNLATMQNRGAETILVNVLDPNREVDPKYVSYLVATEDGRTLTGMIAAETATSITLKRAENATDVVLRIDIEHLQSSRQSIMPEGLEKQLDKQALADVIAYLLALK